MKNKTFAKRVAAVILAISMLITNSALVSAAVGGSNGGTSLRGWGPVGPASSVQSSIVKTYPWFKYSSIANTGYRIYCVDNQENLVTTVLDISYNGKGLNASSQLYDSIYKESLVKRPNSEIKRVKLDAGPLGILRTNPFYGETRVNEATGQEEVDRALYSSTAKEDTGIINYVLNSSYATADEIENDLTSAVDNGNSHSGGKNTQGSDNKTEGSTVVGNNKDKGLNELTKKANNAIRSGDSSQCHAVIKEIMSSYGTQVFSNRNVYNLVSRLSKYAGGGKLPEAIKEAQKLYPSGLFMTSQKQAAYNKLKGKYGSTAAIIAVFKAKATSTGHISGGILNQIAEESSIKDELSQIIPTSSGKEQESSDTNEIDNLIQSYIKFKDKQAQAYIDSNTYKPTDIIMQYNYKIVVEPLTWFRWSNNTYQQASVGFKVETTGEIKQQHQDEKWGWFAHSVPAKPGDPGAHYIRYQDAVPEVVTVTYKWKYRDDSGNEQILETSHDITEGADYNYSSGWKSSNSIKPEDHKPDFAYDGNGVTWAQSAPSLKDASGSYNGYTDWYAVCNNSKYQEDPVYTYGSLRDAVHYCSGKGSANSQLLGLITVYLPAAMTVTSDVEFDGRNFNAMTEDKFTFNGTDLAWLSSNSADYGYGMHMYEANTWFTKTRDDDKTTPGIKHKAPRPKKPEEYLDRFGNITIVKTYREWDGQIGQGEIKSEETMIRDKEPGVVYILNEKDWILSDWYVSTRSELLKDKSGNDNAQAKWDEMKNDVYGNKSNSYQTYAQNSGSSNTGGKPLEDNWTDNENIPGSDGSCKVGLEGNKEGENKNTSTLYVLYERANAEPEDGNEINDDSGNEDLTQSEIYDVTSINSAIDVNTFPGWPSTLKPENGTFISDAATSKYMIARGEDKITLKEFMGNLSVLNNGDGVKTADMMDNWYYGPEGGTAEFKGYTATYILGLMNGGVVSPTNTDLSVGVYHGKKNVQQKYEIGNTGDSYSTRVKTGEMKIVPYYWMTISDLNGNKTLRYMACEDANKRTLSTYDYAEVEFSKKGSLEISSNMWATDKGIKKDSLKGGATYKVSTPEKAVVSATTHSIVWDDYDQTSGSTNVAEITLTDNSENLSSIAASARHENFVGRLAEDIQDDFRLTQYVASGEVGDPAGSSKGNTAPDISIELKSGANISKLGNTGSNKASTGSKYYLEENGDVGTTSLMETNILETESIYTRVFSLPNGNIYYVTGNTYDECDSNMIQIMESARNNGGKYDSSIVCKKGNYTTEGIIADGAVKEAITNSGALQSLVNGIELNTGNDVNAPWCQGLEGDLAKTWYNEGAWVTVLTQKNDIEVGIISMDARMLVVDPKITPKQGKKNNAVVYNSSAFRVDWIGIGNGERGEYSLGEFRGETLSGKDGTSDTLGFRNLFGVSNTFYIPNRTVTDNK